MMLSPGGAFFLVLLIFSSFAFGASRRKTKAVYCTRAENGVWRLQRFEPLINLRSKMVFAEISFAGNMVESARFDGFIPTMRLCLITSSTVQDG